MNPLSSGQTPQNNLQSLFFNLRSSMVAGAYSDSTKSGNAHEAPF